ncbi:antitoxin [Arthrobacter sp. NamB2]|uniref:antitoxin n=1 Tax=Arthrobacter sp. NamB2 TaxID=2576035 RepID=UPI001CB8D56E|nr:antitoxin [Arthrobacter sp. NamB2]
MGLLDGLKGKAGTLAGKATELIGDNSDKVKNGIGKAGDFVDSRTQGKYSSHISGVQTKASQMVDNIDKKDGKGDVGPTSPPAV